MSLVLNVEILGEFKKLNAATVGAEKSLKTLASKVSGISRGISGSLATIGIGFGAAAVVGGIKDSIDAASDQEQQFGALEAVFDNLAPRMQEFATNQNALGLNTADTARQMALLGSQLKGYGLPLDQVADKTESLIGLAADLAATYGGTTADAVDSISSLFRGEFDPIEKYGVAIKKSDINARLAEEGLSGLEGQELKLAEAQTALTLLFDKTADAQGQAARESDTYAAKAGELRAKFDDLQAEIGEKLLPIMVTLMEKVNDNWDAIEDLLLKLGDFLTWIVAEGLPALARLTEGEGFGGLLTIIGSTGVALGLLSNTKLIMFAASNPTLAAAVAGIGLIAGAMYTVWKNTKDATTAIDEFNRIQGIKEVTKNPIATPEQINAKVYAGILDVGKTKVNVPTLKQQQGIAGGNIKNIVTNNITVKKSTATGPDIAKALNAVNKTVGTNVIKVYQ